MRQSEVDTLLNQAIKIIGKQYNWKSRSGLLFCKKEFLFFTAIIVAGAKQSTVSVSLDYKWYDFDELLWNMTDSANNTTQPLSFHARGAWIAPSKRIFTKVENVTDWSEAELLRTVELLLKQADTLSSQLASKIINVEDNLAYLETLQAETLKQYPQAATNLYIEQVLTAILQNNFGLANDIIKDRIANQDSGGLSIGSKSFYALAKEYVQSL